MKNYFRITANTGNFRKRGLISVVCINDYMVELLYYHMVLNYRNVVRVTDLDKYFKQYI